MGGLAALEALAVPFVMRVFPETAVWMARNAWLAWCTAGVGLATVTAAGIGLARWRAERFERMDNPLGLAVDATSAVTMAGLATVAIIKVAEWNLTGYWAAGGWARAGETALATGLALGATYLLFGRERTRKEKARREAEEERMWARRQELGKKVVEARARRAALEAMAQIGLEHGPVFKETEDQIRSLALQAEGGDANAEGALTEVIEAAVRSAPQVRLRGTDDKGIVDGDVAAAFGRARGAVQRTEAYEKKRIK